MGTVRSSGLLGFAVVLFTCVACGSPRTPAEDVSQTSFVPGSSATRARLEARDLDDEFLFHVTVINAPSFHKDALTYSSPIDVVKLRLDGVGGLNPVLRVIRAGESKHLMSFDAAFDSEGRIEVDFASPGNELSMGPSQVASAIEIADSADQAWVTTGRPVVRQVMHDQDTVVADVDHLATTVRSARSGLVAGNRQGLVTIRIFLRRASRSPKIAGVARTVEQGLSQNIGFFASDWRLQAATFGRRAAAENASPITRLALPAEGQLTIYLKGFPQQYLDVAVKSVASWNLAFGRDVLRAEVAPPQVDSGDPRYHVIKWLDDLDDTVKWAGVAKIIADPRTGAVLNTNILVNGNFNIKRYRRLHALTVTLADAVPVLHSRAGNLPLLKEQGEVPAIPFFTDANVETFEEYMEGYYRETITHELGHSLGLRHNFAASTEKDTSTQLAASVMDYAPRPLRNRVEGPGSYDIAALQWGYFGASPTRKLPFCTDEDLETSVVCNQGDDGDPFTYTSKGLVHSVGLLASQGIADASGVVGTVAGLLSNAFKFKRLENQLPDSRKDEILADLDTALDFVRVVEPADTLSDADRRLALGNLAAISDAMQELEVLSRRSR